MLNKTFVSYTLGCRLNFAETSTLSYRLEQLGFKRLSRAGAGDASAEDAQSGGADLVIVNTCAVTEQATAKSRQQINKLIHENPHAFVIVTGCYAQIEPKQLVEKVKGIDVIVGSEYKGDNIESLIGDLTKREETLIYHTEYKAIETFHGGCSADDRTRHFLKVQDGCNYFCTYCTIPMARGKSRSGKIEELVAQAEAVAAKGGKEIVLTGVNIGDFREHEADAPGTVATFFDLIKALDRVEGIERYRIGSIEPNLLTDDMIRWIARESRAFVPHFHIPLQAGSDEVLKLMRRRYDTALFRHKVELIKQEMPDAFIGVDVMAGMRGETDELFQASYDFLKSLPVSQLHPFTYSERTGTKALEIKPIIPVPVRHKRTAQLVELSDQKLRDFYLSLAGTHHSVLWEQPATVDQPVMNGFTDNYIRVQSEHRPELVNTCQQVTLSDCIINTSQGIAVKI